MFFRGVPHPHLLGMQLLNLFLLFGPAEGITYQL